jgi:BASS family bile acid:Na+ symporter
MTKLLGIPILIAFLLGYLFPFTALELSKFAFYILIAMMTLSFLNTDLSKLKEVTKLKKEIFLGLFTLFILTPLIQWLLCHLLLTDETFFYGTFFASLCPIAIVAPQFTKKIGGNENLSFILMFISVLLFPFASSAYLFFLTSNALSIQVAPLFFDAAILTFVPMILALLIKKFLPLLKEKLSLITFNFNMLSIAFLAFAYFGASMSKLNISYTPYREIFMILLILVFQDFVTYFISKWFFPNVFSVENAKSIWISISMKNIAMSGAILLFYDPKASLASALGFLIHALFFTYLLRKRF